MDFSLIWKLQRKSGAIQAYAGSGRSHNQTRTMAMQVQASMRAHSGVGVSHRMTAHTAIMAAALRLARRLTNPPACQFCSMGPNNGWFHSHACMRGELRMAAQPAIKIKTVVGRPGMNTPRMPRPSDVTAKARSSQRVYQRRTKAGAGVVANAEGSSDLAGKDMVQLCLCVMPCGESVDQMRFENKS